MVSRLPDKSLRRHTYGEFYRRTRSLASALRRLGLKKGDRVAVLESPGSSGVLFRHSCRRGRDAHAEPAFATRGDWLDLGGRRRSLPDHR
ncbi:AMP-binding protein [Bradyrhizobium sp. CCBAU 11434]|uniref:AMP-binding protein n=1 Tax=Bradyrhizobium sp. CCBAU 11434 TaxID=1630885 RepID=UPI003FA45AE3